MTRSVSSLHNTSTSPNSSEANVDEVTLRSQYGDRRRSGMTSSIRNLNKLSNTDLTEDQFAQEVKNFDNSNGSYYSATLPKNLRKGAVQKRMERSNPSILKRFDQQTTSGDSDSNASDAPYNGSSVQQRAQLFQQRNTPNGTQFRSISSVGANRMNVVARNKPNYLARMNQSDEAASPNSTLREEERTPLAELQETEGISAAAKSKWLKFCIGEF